MFYYFFEDCKKIYSVSFKELDKQEKKRLFIAIFFLLVYFALFIAITVLNNLLYTSIFLGLSIGLGIFFHMNEKKKLAFYRRKHKENKIDKLIVLLDDDEYKLYNESGIEMLMDFCKEKIEKHTVLTLLTKTWNVFALLAIPAIFLFLEFVFGTFENIDEAIIFLTQYIMFIILLCVPIVALKSSVKFGEKYESLYQDLYYIKTQLNNKDSENSEETISCQTE